MNKIWLVGASEGIGRSLAIELAKDKNNYLILSARNTDRLNDLAKEIGSITSIFPLNVSDKDSVSAAWEAIKNEHKAIDTVIYCAGYYTPMSSSSMQMDKIEEMIDVNLTGAIRIVSMVVPEFINQRSGHIVLIGSIAAYRGLPHGVGYGSSKAGIIHLAENLNCDLSKFGIKVQVINPGFVKTRLTALNKFYMPSILSPEQAAQNIIKYIKSNKFESRFPFIFANFLKIISKLPYFVYFRIAKLLEPKE